MFLENGSPFELAGRSDSLNNNLSLRDTCNDIGIVEWNAMKGGRYGMRRDGDGWEFHNNGMMYFTCTCKGMVYDKVDILVS